MTITCDKICADTICGWLSISTALTCLNLNLHCVMHTTIPYQLRQAVCASQLSKVCLVLNGAGSNMFTEVCTILGGCGHLSRLSLTSLNIPNLDMMLTGLYCIQQAIVELNSAFLLNVAVGGYFAISPIQQRWVIRSFWPACLHGLRAVQFSIICDQWFRESIISFTERALAYALLNDVRTVALKCMSRVEVHLHAHQHNTHQHEIYTCSACYTCGNRFASGMCAACDDGIKVKVAIGFDVCCLGCVPCDVLRPLTNVSKLTLWLHGHDLHPYQFYRISNSIAACQRLQVLNLHYNHNCFDTQCLHHIASTVLSLSICYSVHIEITVPNYTSKSEWIAPFVRLWSSVPKRELRVHLIITHPASRTAAGITILFSQYDIHIATSGGS